MRAVRLCAVALWLGASPAFAQISSVLVVSGLSSPVAVVKDPTQANVLFVVEQGGRIRVVHNGTLGTPFLDLTTVVLERRRARSARARVPARLRDERPLLRQLHRTRPATPSSRGSSDRREPARRRSGVAVRSALGRAASRVHRAAVRQPQRRRPGVRAGRLPLHRPRRRRQRRRSGASRAEPDDAARQDAAHRRQRAGRRRRRATAFPPTTRSSAAAAARCPEIWASACATRGAAASTTRRAAARARWSSATSAGRWEEIDYEPAARGGRNYGWRNREGAHCEVTRNRPRFCR